MNTPRTRAGWLGGAIAAAALALALGPGFYSHADPAAARTAVAVNCPPPTAPLTSQDGNPSC